MNKKVKKGCLISFLIVVWLSVLSYIVSDWGENGATTEKEAKEKTINKTTSKEMAFVQAKNIIEPMLKSPSTAKFPIMDYSCTQVDSNIYVVKSYVDSQNGFGAIVRTNYVMKLLFKGGQDSDTKNWELLDIKTD